MTTRPAGGEVYDETATGHLVDVSSNSLMLAVRLARQRRADKIRRGWTRSLRRVH